MKIITCAGYFNTGSSAITDFFTEFDNCKSLGIAEIRILQDPDGVSSLEYNIIEHPHRHNTSHAIKRFIKLAKFENGNALSKRYRKLFGNNFMEYTNEYISDIVSLKAPGTWRYDAIEKGDFFYMIDALFRTIVMKTFHRRLSLLNLTGEQCYYSNITKEEFYRFTKKYMNNLLSSASPENTEYIMVDQLVPPNNIDRYCNYVNDLFVIVSERDPRDLYINEVEIPCGVIPIDSIEHFCEWYKITRTHRKNEEFKGNSMFLYFEDWIYKYDETSKRIEEFVGLDEKHHTKKKHKLNPEVSIKNTRMWLRHPECKKEIAYIEKELEEYLYDYSFLRNESNSSSTSSYN